MTTVTAKKSNSIKARHSSASDRWGTPLDILYAAEQVLGGIDLDPASEVGVNRLARAFLSRGFDALMPDAVWGTDTAPKSIWLNPPGGRREATDVTAELFSKGTPKQTSNVKLFWQKLLREARAGHVKHALFLSFSIEAAQTTQLQCDRSILDFPTVFFNKRLQFRDLTTGETVKGNTHSSCLTYLPGTVDKTYNFLRVFSDFGVVVEPAFNPVLSLG